MGKVIFFACLVSHFIFWDIQLRLRLIVNRKKATEYLNRKIRRIVRIIFALARTYINFVIKKELAPYQQRVKDQNLTEPFLMISNHQSVLDIAVLYYCFPDHQLRFVAKSVLARGIPLVSIVIRMQQHALVNRIGKFSETMKELTRLALMSQKGFCPVIFPEGTRSRTGSVGHFHSGAVRRILDITPMPVISVAVGGGSALYGAKAILKNLQNAVYKVKVLSFYSVPKTKKNIIEIFDKTYEETSRQVDLWQNKNVKG
ncbi:MAG: lysophospholipid acyltransferase family protein [Spirochaetota bacterium]